MTKEENFKLLKIQTCVLKVNIHCDGCKQKVKKLLQRTEGVYQVSIDAEQQKVTVSGSVDSATLIKKLVRAGKHAEVWSPKSNQNQNQNPKQNNCIKDDRNSINKGQKQGLIKGLEAFKNQQKFPVFIPQEEDDDYMDDYDEDDEEYELQFLKPSQMCQLGQMRLARQQALDANNARKGVGIITAGASTNNGKMNNNAINGNSGKKENQNQNMGMKINPGLLDQKTLAALKMNNAQLGGLNINATEGNRGSDINPMMMGVSGFHGNGANAAAALGGNPNSVGGFQVQSNNGLLQGSSASSFPHGGYVTTGQYPSSMLMNMNNGYNNHPSSSSMMSMMNMQNMHAMQQQQQPQMMYHRSPVIPPSTGYCYYNYSTPPYSVPEAPNYNADHHSTATTTHMFNDDNTSSSCSIM